MRGALLGIFNGREKKEGSCNLQDSDDGEHGGSGTGSCLFSLLDLTFILLPFAHLLFTCSFSV